ncbi:MAG: MATE family efflux transporter [Deltaproteobacteria bacterium]|nr:MATE family efflux transporter [Desulfitobacteriaceae bacterium]MDI6854777.1 MATE family efflux transporter [Deltaproteobacteria bacterium]
MKSSRTSKYLAGLFTGYTVTLATLAVGFWLTPFTLRFLDREEFGIFSLAVDLLIWLTFLDLGITAALKVQAAQLTGCPHEERLSRLASTAFFTQLVVIGSVALLGALFIYLFPSFFQVRPELQKETQQVIALMILGTALTLFTQTFSGILVAHQQIHIDNLIRLISLAVRTTITVILLLNGWKMLSLAVASVAANTIIAGLAVMRVKFTLPWVTIRYRLASWQTFGSLFSLGVWFSIGGVAGILIESFDRVVAGRLVSLESVTTLTLTGRVYMWALMLLGQITDTARPALGQLMGQGKYKETLTNYRHLVALTAGGAIMVSASLWSCNGFFVPWWVGGQNYGGTLLDLAMAANLIVHAWILPNRATLASGLIVKPQTICRVIEGCLNLLLAIILGMYFGLLGIVVSTAIAGILTSAWFLPFLTLRLFKQQFRTLFQPEAFRILLFFFFSFFVSYEVRFLGLSLSGIRAAFITGLATFLISGLLLYFLIFSRELKSKLRENILSLMPRQ